MATPAQRARRRRARARRATNKNKGGGKAQGSQASGKKTPRSMNASKLEEMACAFWNPFCSPVGIKWPDENAGRTIAWRERYRATLPVNSTSYLGAAYFFPRLKSPFYLDAVTTVDDFPVINLGSGSEWPDNVSDALPVKSYRIVNFGVRVRYIGPALYARGLLTFSTMEGDATTEYPDSPSAYAVEKQTYAIKPGLDVCWCSRALSSTSREFLSNTTTSALSTFSALALFFDGLDEHTANGLHVEILSHMELLPTPSGGLVHAATPAAASNLSFIQSVTNVVRDLPSTVENFGSAVNNARKLASMFASPTSLPMLTW